MKRDKETTKASKKSENLIKVKITNIKGNMLECAQLMSNFKVSAKCPEDMDLEVGQTVMIKMVNNREYKGYIVEDSLTEEVEAEVLDVQHIISDGVMYISLIVMNPVTKKRMHSLVPSTDRLFCKSTNVIIKGDIVTLKINNGVILNIKLNGEEL